MKNIYQFLILLIFNFVIPKSQAQSTFNALNCFQLNDSSKLGFAVVSDTFENFVSQTSNNYTWDFTNTGSPGPWTSWTNPSTSYLFQPASQSIHSLFANSQINEYAILPFARDHFYSYSPSQDTLFFDGFYTSTNYQYIPSIPYLTFPLSFSDSITHSMQSTLTGSPELVTRTWIYDGFGILKLPYGIVNNVIRIRTKQIDSSTVINFTSISEEIIWVNPVDGIPVLRFVKQGPTTIAAYYASATGSSNIDELTNKDISIFPNPLINKIQITNTSSQAIKEVFIYDALGNLILNEHKSTHQILLPDIADGLYIIDIRLDDNTRIRKKLQKL